MINDKFKIVVFINLYFPGMNDVADWQVIDVFTNDAYLPCTLTNTNLTSYTPVYYVSLSVRNGAGLWSSVMSSTPIVVVAEDVTGIETKMHFCSLSLDVIGVLVI